jgi:lipopolysaccharide assembly LapA-like protein
MIWRFTKVVLAALIIFVVFNFLLTNLGPQALGYRINFQFNVPPILYLESASFPVGILLLIAFCLGMIFAAFMGAISVFHRSRELKAKNRTIHELEKEIEELRAIYSAQRRGALEEAPNEPDTFLEKDEAPSEPRIE